ncbi:NADH dehydrogenase FAD-containing subunit [Saccharothrix saharensis]|uniref:NADH dehydrogenase FAD-containing subunit n=1 Tax=Saccharothrix saharensis TaxID=571190 RepID=A0A543JKN5_9PSEU|nr:FAD-dependent oxidoreductase [Saccharothrix saharensis]TQM83344.1 NADH dehydrogenase FAD-containing subunit [Saccharothrix saharensis]
MAEHIVVVGAGYAGLAAAKLAAKWTDSRVTLVNARDRFVERVLLHQLAVGQRMRDVPLADVLKGTGVELVVDRVTEIDPEAREVGLTDGALAYDRLIYALGSYSDLSGVPGATGHAHTVSTREDAEELAVALEGARAVAVVGGGLTGIEAASELAESRPDLEVLLVTGGGFGDDLSDKGRRHLRGVFDRLGVRVRDHAHVTGVRADGLVLDDGELVGADTVVWTAGFAVPDLAARAGFAVDGRGRMLVDQTLTSISHPEVQGIGDAAAMKRHDGLELRMACATGLPTTQQAVRALAKRVGGGEPADRLDFRYHVRCVSLGRRDGLIQFVDADDTPKERVLTGRVAAVAKELVVRGALLFQSHPTMPAG